MVKAEYIMDNENEIKEIYTILGYSRKNKKRDYIIFLFLAVVMCIINIISEITSNNHESNPWAWSLIIFILSWKIYKESNIYQNILNDLRRRRMWNKNIYSFCDGGIIVDKIGNSYSENKNYGYDLIAKAVETDEYFCWQYYKPVFEAIKKSAIIEGSVEELRTLFEIQLGNKFVSKVK